MKGGESDLQVVDSGNKSQISVAIYPSIVCILFLYNRGTHTLIIILLIFEKEDKKEIQQCVLL